MAGHHRRGLCEEMDDPPTLPVARILKVLEKSIQDEGTTVEHLEKWKRTYLETGSDELLRVYYTWCLMIGIQERQVFKNKIP